jgi:hypothetical protein
VRGRQWIAYVLLVWVIVALTVWALVKLGMH